MQDWCDSRKWSEDEVWAKRHSKHEASSRENGQFYWSHIRTSSRQESFEPLKAHIERIHYGGYKIQNYHQEMRHQHDFRRKERNKWEHSVILEGEEILTWRLVTSRGKQKSTRGKEWSIWKWQKRILAKEVRPTKWNGHKCCPSIITSRIKFVASNIWRYGHQFDGHVTILLRLCKIKRKITCSQKEDVHKSVKSRTKDFFGHNWSITGGFDWGPVLDWRNRLLQTLLLEFLYKDQVTTAK